ncbi:MAG: plasmid mobilization relaxosome protein MobC [Clostridia bacterium]|nr:plasmid mobilization relaxosome protein MobC [Clostridia bacterium]
MRKRNRDNAILFWVSNEEKEAIKKKMELYGSQNMSAYIRKMAIDGYVINFDIPELKETTRLLRYTSNNINQIAIKVNATGVVFQNEIKEIQENQAQLWCMLDKIIARFSKIK